MSNLYRANILVLGRTGVGKSSFINYLLSANKADVGVGKPITQDIFNKYDYKDENGMEIHIIDTKGIEVKDANEYVPKLVKNIIDNCNSYDPRKWYHTIFYCVSMNNQRFEPFEIKLINDLSKNINQSIHIVLTHFKEEDYIKADNMEKYIQEKLDKNTKKNINFYRVCSVNKKTRKGEIKPYGRELIVNRIFETFLKDVCQKVSKKYAEDSYNIYYKIIDDLEKDTISFLGDNLSIFTISEIEEKFEKFFEKIEPNLDIELSKLTEKFNKAIVPVQEIYNSYNKILNKSHSNCINLENIFDDINVIKEYEDFDVEEKFNKSNFGKLINELEGFDERNGEILSFECFRLMSKAVKQLFSIKKDVINIFKSVFIDIKNDFNKSYIETTMYNRLCEEIFETEKLNI